MLRNFGLSAATEMPVRLGQSSNAPNAPRLMSITLAGIDTRVRVAQWANANPSILVTLFGSVKQVSPVQPRSA